MTSTTARGQTPPDSLAVRTARVGDLEIRYDDRVLQPRPWTAAQARWAADLLDAAEPGPLLELCTGAGHIGLLAILHNRRRLVAVDADPVASRYARLNAEAAGLGDRVEIRNADLEDALAADERFPVILADPPWVPSDRTSEHPEDPPFAIDGGDDGLAVARRCVVVAAGHLSPGGALLLQLGTLEQAEALEEGLGDALAGAPALVLAEARQLSTTGVVACLRSRAAH